MVHGVRISTAVKPEIARNRTRPDRDRQPADLSANRNAVAASSPNPSSRNQGASAGAIRSAVPQNAPVRKPSRIDHVSLSNNRFTRISAAIIVSAPKGASHSPRSEVDESGIAKNSAPSNPETGGSPNARHSGKIRRKIPRTWSNPKTFSAIAPALPNPKIEYTAAS